MDTNLLLAHIQKFTKVQQEEASYLNTLLISRTFKKNEISVCKGDPARYLAYVNVGYTVTYFTDHDANDHVVRFAAAGWWTGDVYSLSQETTTPLTTKALSNGELLLLPKLAHQELLRNYPKFERYFRNIFQGALIRHQMLFVESRSMTAEERYLKLQITFPGVEQYLPQKYIASYLGITPEFLSKIRNNLAK